MSVYQLRVTVGSAGIITRVTAYVQLGTLTSTTWQTAMPTYGVSFEYASSGTVTRRTSGRPGYQRGLPLLIADGTDVRVDGLWMLPRSSLGVCSSGGAGATQVLFGESTMRSCTTTLSAADLAAFCQAGLQPSEQPLIAALNLTGSTKVGVYGDSHPDNDADWVPLTVRYPSNDPSNLRPAWTESTQTCSNVLSGINLRILYTKIGSVTAPISKVIGAELVFTARTVTATRCPLGRTCDTIMSVTSSMTFADVAAESFEYVPETPQIIPPLPYDFFYPFFVG